MKKKDILRRYLLLPKLLLDIVDILICCLLSLFLKNKSEYKNLWLICDRGIEAQDNGFALFKYIREEHQDINAHFIVNKNLNTEYVKVKGLGNVIQYKSLKHKLAYLLCDKAISSHIGSIQPWNYRLCKFTIDNFLDKKNVFLQHGVTLGDISSWASKSSADIDLFITATIPEFESISLNEKYGFLNSEVVLTGFSRHDNLYNNKTEKKILIMPTWRNSLVNIISDNKNLVSLETFKKSEYYRRFQSLINNPYLIKLLVDKGYTLIFHPHYQFQRYLESFSSDSSNVEICSKVDYDVQDLLKKSELLITDFSSVAFDFAYMKKPVLYYQFDNIHTKKGYFSFENDGFGMIFNQENLLVEEIIRIIERHCTMELKYIKRVESTFPFNDTDNCKRIFNCIEKLDEL